MSVLMAAVLALQDKGAEETFKTIEETIHNANTVSMKFKWEARKKGEEAKVSAEGTLLVKKGNKIFATETFLIEGKKVEKRQISDGSTTAFWVNDKPTCRITPQNEGPKLLNGLIRAGYVQAQLIKVNLIPLEGELDPGKLDPRLFVPLGDFVFGENEGNARTIAHSFKDSKDLKGKLWYDPKTLRLLKRTIDFDGEDAGTAVEIYEEFTLDADIPDDKFRIPFTREMAQSLALDHCDDALALEARNDSEGAIKAYTAAVKADPACVRAFFSRGLLNKTKRDSTAALHDFDRAIELQPQTAIFYGYRAQIRRSREDLNGAIQDCRKALELDPGKNWIRIELGKAHLDRRDFDGAIDAFSKALEIEPKNVLSLLLRIVAKYKKGDFTGAAADVEKVEGVSPGNPDAAYYLGNCHLACRRWNDARAAYVAALRSAPEDWSFRERTEALVSAIPDLMKTQASLTPSRRVLEVAQGWIAKGETDRAIELLEEAIELDYRSPEAIEACALACFSLREKDPSYGRRAVSKVFDLLGLRHPIGPQLIRILRAQSSMVLGGLLWLGDHQMADGRWSSIAFDETCLKDKGGRCDGRSEAESDVRTTAIALLAYHGAGYSHLSVEVFIPGKPLGGRLMDAWKWLLAKQGEDGGFGPRESARRVEDSAIVAWVLAEALSLTAAKPLQEPARKVAAYLLSQRIPGSGWPVEDKGAAANPTTTAWVLLALRELPSVATNEAVSALEKSVLSGKAAPGNSDWALAVAATAVSRQTSPALPENVKAISDEGEGKGDDALRTLASAIALRTGGSDEAWKSWQAATRSGLTKRVFVDRGQQETCVAGSWKIDPGADLRRGRVVTTALNILTLEICYGYAHAPFQALRSTK